MTNAEALRRAKAALKKAHDDSDAFDHGGMASWEIMDSVTRALVAEFSAPKRS